MSKRNVTNLRRKRSRVIKRLNNGINSARLPSFNSLSAFPLGIETPSLSPDEAAVSSIEFMRSL